MKKELPQFENEEQREDAIRRLKPNHGYSLSEAANLLGISTRTLLRRRKDSFSTTTRMGKPRILGLDIRKYYYS